MPAPLYSLAVMPSVCLFVDPPLRLQPPLTPSSSSFSLPGWLVFFVFCLGGDWSVGWLAGGWAAGSRVALRACLLGRLVILGWTDLFVVRLIDGRVIFPVLLLASLVQFY